MYNIGVSVLGDDDFHDVLMPHTGLWHDTNVCRGGIKRVSFLSDGCVSTLPLQVGITPDLVLLLWSFPFRHGPENTIVPSYGRQRPLVGQEDPANIRQHPQSCFPATRRTDVSVSHNVSPYTLFLAAERENFVA